MNITDIFRLSFSNLKRTKVRSFLTGLGVTIGIGALVSMVSFGVGMQKNITDSFKKNELFTNIFVTPAKIDMSSGPRHIASAFSDDLKKSEIPVLDDSAVEKIRQIPGVKEAFPEVSLAAIIKIGTRKVKTRIKGIPVSMGKYPPFDKLTAGSFFSSDTSLSLILKRSLLYKLKFRLKNDLKGSRLTAIDSLKNFISVDPDTLINTKAYIVTSVIDINKISGLGKSSPLGFFSSPPVKEVKTPVRISAILDKSTGFGSSFGTDAYMPINALNKIPHIGFNSVWEILGTAGRKKGFESLTVKVNEINDVESVCAKIDSMGFGTMSIINQLEEMKRGFIVFDTILGAIGAVALLVAALGIINTMLMSILERTKEIGIIKAIGGSEGEVKLIFIIEACTIGFFGGIFGIGLGWVVTKIAGVIGNFYIVKEGGTAVNLFHIPWWLILGAMAFAVLISLISGLFPAARAARTNPVEALRRE